MQRSIIQYKVVIPQTLIITPLMCGPPYSLTCKFSSMLPCFPEDIEATALPLTRLLSVDFAALSALLLTLLSSMDGTVGLTVEQDGGF